MTVILLGLLALPVMGLGLILLWASVYITLTFSSLLLCAGLRRHEPLGRCQGIRAAVGEWWAAIAVFLCALAQLCCCRAKPPRQAVSTAPIVLIHGYMAPPLMWCWFRWRLQRQLAAPVHVVRLRPALAGIRALAADLQQQLHAMATHSACSGYHLVGHSMGGLVGACYAAELSEPGQVLSLTTIGTPWHGTVLAPCALGANARDMRCRSAFIAQLLAAVQRQQCPTMAIASLCDNVVIPWQNALVSPDKALAHDNSTVIRGCGHMQLVFHRDVLASTCAHLHACGVPLRHAT